MPNARVWASGNTISHNQFGFDNQFGAFESAGNYAVRNNAQDTSGTIDVVATK